MIRFSYILVFLFIESLSFFLNDSKQFYVKVVNCNIHIIDSASSSKNAKEYIYLGKNYKDEEEQKKENYKELSYFLSLNDIPNGEKELIDKHNSLREIYNKQFLQIGDFFNSHCNKKYYSTKITQLEYLCKKNDIFTKAKINENYQIEKKNAEELLNNYGYFLFSDLDKKNANNEIGSIFSSKNNISDICSNNEIPFLHISAVCETKKNINDYDNDQIHIKSFLNKNENISLACSKYSINILSAYYVSEDKYYKDNILNRTNQIKECCNGFNECNVSSSFFLNMIKQKKEGKTDIGNNPLLLVEYKCDSKNLKENSADINYFPTLSGNKCFFEENKPKSMKNRKNTNNYAKNFQNTKNLSHYYILFGKKSFYPLFLKLKEKMKIPHISKNNKESSNVIKRRKYIFNDYKKGKKMLNNLLLHNKKNIFLKNAFNSHTQTHNNKSFFNNHLKINKKNDLKIYKMKNNMSYKSSKNTMFLETYKADISIPEENLKKDGEHFHLPFKIPFSFERLNGKLKLLEEDIEWMTIPYVPISCRETSCPNAYQMCVPMFIDEKRFFNGKKFDEIVREILGNHMRKEVSFPKREEFVYSIYYACVCKKSGSDNFCDESVE
ncbi:conserved Plasmodium protein, unknown function [Plasmodium relictum]|uniref:Uncharacterized protein n=1 Tax=Plasmodium relictum TaxID=85471 RepID=A0A1J1H2N1_PLARL|nr:conserved Plasmodium protein, unknown function [Plasmodium relictum]CRG98965.1 conserved Plasmodium protein, unknown function [Plasmodium relictum]